MSRDREEQSGLEPMLSALARKIPTFQSCVAWLERGEHERPCAPGLLVRRSGGKLCAPAAMPTPAPLAPEHEYLEPTRTLDFEHPLVLERAAELGRGVSDPVELAARAFTWVRDEIQHSQDFEVDTVTCSASEVLFLRAGFCYAKAHLLVALLRANRLRAGLCYQRLRFGGNQYSLHGLCAVELPELGWYRIDPRGNKPGVSAAFTPPREQLAFQVKDLGEWDDARIWPRPLRVVTDALRTHRQRMALLPELPDLAEPADLAHAALE